MRRGGGAERPPRVRQVSAREGRGVPCVFAVVTLRRPPRGEAYFSRAVRIRHQSEGRGGGSGEIIALFGKMSHAP